MNSVVDVHVSLCDYMNPSIGYQVTITGTHGRVIVRCSRDPQDGSDLLTLKDVIRVVNYYTGGDE